MSPDDISIEQVRENLRNLQTLMPDEPQALYELGSRLVKDSILTINPLVFIIQSYSTLNQMFRDIIDTGIPNIKASAMLTEFHALRGRLPDISKVVFSEEFSEDVRLWKARIDALPYSL